MKTNFFGGIEKPKRHVIIHDPTPIDSLSYDELEDDVNYRWVEKSRRMQIRRWKSLKHQISG